MERVAVQVDRVMVHRREVADPDPDALARADDEGRRARERLGVHGQHVELGHLERVGSLGARVDAPLVQHDGEVPIDAPVRAARVDDEQARHPQRHLRHLVVVRVVHRRAALAQRELVLERLARRDRLLREAADAVHPVDQLDAVPMDGGRRRQSVGHVDAHAIALDGLDHRAVDAAAIAPALDLSLIHI